MKEYMMKGNKEAITLYLDKDILKSLQRRSLELSLKSEKKVTRSEIVERALIKFGVKPK